MTRALDPWSLPEAAVQQPSPQARASVLAVSNGWVGVRGALDELRPAAGPATLMAAAHDDVPLTYAEPAYGYPSSSEHLVPVPDAWAVQLRVDDHPFDVRLEPERHERTLDLRRAVLRRELDWTTPSGARVEVRSDRFASLARRELVLVQYEVRATTAARVELRPFPCCAGAPGAAEAPEPDPDRPALVVEACAHDGERSTTVHRAVRSGVRVGAAGVHRVEAADGVQVHRGGGPHVTTLAADLAPGQWLRLVLPVAYVAGPDRAADGLLADARAVLDGVADLGWDALLDEHAAVLAEVWEHGDVVLDGDEELQRAVRYGILQAVQAGAGSADVGIRAKGLTGTGYDGHTFWDADTYVAPVLDHVLPAGAQAHLRWRHATLPAARDRARVLGLEGAAYPWRTITGRESSGYWPAGSAAVHATADVADAVVRHAVVTRDETFLREVALDVVVEAARMYAGLGRWGSDGRFHIDGVTGPDEYSALLDDNAFTNLMAARTLRWAALLTSRLPQEAGERGVTPDERAAWQRAAEAIAVPYDDELGVTQQAARYTELAVWDFAAERPQDYPLHGSSHYSALYRHQVLKQADVVMAAYLAHDAFTPEQKRRDLDYYEPLTVRDSSLSAPPQAVVAAEVGYLDLAWAYTRETALVDLRDDGRPTADGVHVAAHAGAWTALVAGFGGLRWDDDGLHLRPVLPPALRGLSFGLRLGPSTFRVQVTPTTATYRLTGGPRVVLTHDGGRVELTPAVPEVTRPVSPRPAPGPTPRQPPGREPFA
ncbi:glycoside hydrolase family 65 protein [Cellulomonas sp. APG4]|uniref:glycoside hydrolase family 65 protein n=1 Tax=Cellulomonas sp. APG4 TaxID=1538656 RepID=UPI00137A31A8|nr:glycoside hydrolase family 65 protein [Cellulomonas sp. APG4]NCT92401.1 glycoside hydrolase family 65 protein [Cellulomonas sp. APG4]